MEITFLPTNTSEIQIYTWNNSYRTPTECCQKNSDLPKGKKLPTCLGRAKEKRKNRDRRIGMGPAPVGGSCEGGKVSTHTRKPLRGRRLQVAEGGSFRATEGSTATGVQRAKRRDSRTEDRCRLTLTSPRGLSAHRPGRAGAGG